MSSSSSGPTRSRNKSSFLINDRTTHMYISNSAIYRFEVWKERDAPANHEFVVIRMENLANHSYYRIERRPSNEIVNLIDKVRGCGAEDTITPLSERGYASLPRFADCFICIRYRDPAAPRLQTIFDICKLIHKDRDAEKYTLTKYNCYFFARTLTLLIARYFLVRHYCVLNKSPRNKFCDSGGRHIDTFLDGVIPTRDPWIRIKFFDNSSVRMILSKLSLRIDFSFPELPTLAQL